MKYMMEILKKSAYYIAIGIMVAFVIANPIKADMVQDGLVAYWSFDENTIKGNTVSDIIGDNDGNLKGGKLVAGKINGAIEFDGNTDVDVAGTDATDFNGADELTAAAWFNPDADDPVGNQAAAGCCGSIVAQRDAAGWAIRYDGRNPGMEIEFIVCPGWQGDGGFGAEKVEPKTWHYITGVVDRDTMRLYLDGEMVAEQPFAGPIGSAGTGVDIGFGADGSFIGVIDEVALYNKALSDAEVMQNFKSKEFFAVEYQDKLAVCWGKVKGK